MIAAVRAVLANRHKSLDSSKTRQLICSHENQCRLGGLKTFKYMNLKITKSLDEHLAPPTTPRFPFDH
jgi:hypothetical protein